MKNVNRIYIVVAGVWLAVANAFAMEAVGASSTLAVLSGVVAGHVALMIGIMNWWNYQ